MSYMRATHSPNCCATLCQQTQARDDVLDPFNPVGNLLDVATKFLSQGKGRRILQSRITSGEAGSRLKFPLARLQVRSADLDDVIERLCFIPKSNVQLLQSRK